MSVTTITITDPQLLAQLAAADGPIVFRGPTGDTVKTLAPVSLGAPPAGFQPAIGEEELARRRLESTGRGAADILNDLRAKHGEK